MEHVPFDKFFDTAHTQTLSKGEDTLDLAVSFYCVRVSPDASRTPSPSLLEDKISCMPSPSLFESAAEEEAFHRHSMFGCFAIESCVLISSLQSHFGSHLGKAR